ncbi:MAG: GNAT family N-acetyltransferase [Pseudomonas sp.]|uniref:GNAT family N-acetyltransferase n=1 Tax=Pseudomonas sp. TaxID=306 RepID=UPI00339AE55A
MPSPIETPKPIDLPRLLEVWEAAVRASHDFLPDGEIELIRPLLASQYFPALELTCVRADSGQVLGFLGRAEHKVEMLFVDPVAQGQGVGRTLLRHAMEQGARGVDVNEQNPAALGFYLSQGFSVAGRSPRDGGGRPYPLLHLALPEA